MKYFRIQPDLNFLLEIAKKAVKLRKARFLTKKTMIFEVNS